MDPVKSPHHIGREVDGAAFSEALIHVVAHVLDQGGDQPPPSYLVPALIEDMCDYVNERFTESSAVHLAAYVMWRLNWIHPFADGNGRTSRATSYMVLCLRLRERLPGSHTIPEQIVRNRGPYFAALDSADAAAQTGAVDVSKMEALLSDMLAAQLLSVVE